MPVRTAADTAALEIHLLGSFQVYVHGRPLPEPAVKGRKARALLKLVALRRNAQVVRDVAMDTFWPNLDERSAAAQLYKALHHIRKALSAHAEEAGEADEWVEITDDVIRLAPPGGVATDVQRFEKSARAGLRDGGIADLQMAVSVYVGDLLPTDFYAGWTTLPREHYRQLFLDVLVALSAQYEQRGELSEAAEMLRLALEKDPALEAAHRGLMRIFARRGQTTRSIRQFEQCAKVLREELSVDPSPETVAVLDGLRRRRVSDASGGNALPATVPTPMAPLVGREAECTRIEQLLDRLATGTGGVLVIHGDVGMGKTRLAQEIALRTRRRGIRVFSGAAREDEGKAAYGPFIEIFDAVLHRYPALSELLPTEIGRLVPGFSGDGAPVPGADKLAAQTFLFAQVKRFFARFTKDSPAVVILDDLHAADNGSVGLFHYLARHARDLSILLAVTTRDRLFAAKFERAAAEPRATVFRLDPLDADQHTRLLQQHAGEHKVDPGDLDRIYQTSEGNPFFALELYRYQSVELDAADGRGERMGESAGPTGIPPLLLRIVDRKIEELSPSAHHLLYIAAVIGRHVSFEVLSAVWSGTAFVDEDSVIEPLEEVMRTGLFEERGLDYSFRHALVRETIYRSVSEARRRALHALVAHRLIETSDREKPVERIAHHLVRAGEIRHGVSYLIRSGERAEAAYAHEDALQRYREAIEALDTLEDERVARRLKRTVLERIGDVYRACGRLERSYDAYERAVDVAEGLPVSAPDLVELHRKIAVVGVFRTEIDRSERHLGLAFDLVGEDARARARLLITKALVRWHMNVLEEAVALGHDALELARSVDAHVEASQACEILAMTYLPLGRWKEGLKYEMERKRYGWSPEIVVATDAHLCLWEYHLTGDQPFQQARSFIRGVARQASEIGDLRCVAVCHYALGTMHLWRGENREADEELDASLHLHENVGSPAGMAYALARKGVLHTMAGAVGAGWEAVCEGLEHAERAAVRDHCLQRLYGVGIWNRQVAGDHDEVRVQAERGLALLEESGPCSACALELYPHLAYFYLESGDLQRVRECEKAIAGLADQTGNPIGRAMAAMIGSSLSLADRDEERAGRRRQEAFQLAEDAVAEATHSPVVHFLDRMVEQQVKLRPGFGI